MTKEPPNRISINELSKLFPDVKLGLLHDIREAILPAQATPDASLIEKLSTIGLHGHYKPGNRILPIDAHAILNVVVDHFAEVGNMVEPSEIRDNKLPLDVDVAEIVCSKIEQGRYGDNPSQYLIANVAAQYAITFMSEREPVMSRPDAAAALSKAILEAHEKWKYEYQGVGHE